MTRRLLHVLFRLSIVAFLIGGTVTVLGQALGIVLGDAAWVETVAADAGPATCVAASICGMLSFVLSYGKQDGADETAEAHAPRPVASAATH
ncbi:hypothetical protein [Streptomyces sp. WG-D5]